MEPGEKGGLHSRRLCSVEGTGLTPVIASFNLHGRSIGLAQNRQHGSHGSAATCCCLIAQLNRNVVEASPMTQYQSVQARCLRLLSKAADAASIAPAVESRALSRGENELLIELKAAAVNPSDVKAATGLMPYAVFPRTPGRDYAGVVIDGPTGWIGREVFGSSGDLGIRRDGTHATHLAVEVDAVVEKPKRISWEEAAGIGVPFVTAEEGFRRAGIPKPGETVLVFGANGKVGQAAVQIATWQGARIIGVVRKAEPYEGHTNATIEVIDASANDVATRVRELTGGRGADIVFNTVGDPYFQAAHKSLALRGRPSLIAGLDRLRHVKHLEFFLGGQH